MAVEMNWSAIGLGSVIAFIIGWFLFGLLGAVILAIIVLVLTGILGSDDKFQGKGMRDLGRSAFCWAETIGLTAKVLFFTNNRKKVGEYAENY
jgi:hypothetical protein